MYCIQTSASLPPVKVGPGPVFRRPSVPRIRVSHACGPSRVFPKIAISVPKHKKCMYVCGAFDKGMSYDADDESQDARSKDSGLFGFPGNGDSLEQSLRKEMEARLISGDGAGGFDGNRPKGGGGGGFGGGSGRGGDFGLPDKKAVSGFLDDTVQFILATGALVAFYWLFLKGLQPILLARDYVLYRFFGGRMTMRLSEAMINQKIRDRKSGRTKSREHQEGEDYESERKKSEEEDSEDEDDEDEDEDEDE